MTKEEKALIEKWRKLLSRMAEADETVIHVDLNDFIRPQLGPGKKGVLAAIAQNMFEVLSRGDRGIPDYANPIEEGRINDVLDILSALGEYGTLVLDQLDGTEALKRANQAVDKLIAPYNDRI